MPAFSTEGLTAHLVFAVIAAAFGSAFQHGYNTGVVNAPQDLIEEFIGDLYMSRNEGLPTNKYITLIFSTLVSIFCVGGMVGAFATAFFADKFGRRGGLLMNNILVFTAAALEAFSKTAGSYEMIIVGRFIIGVNSGLNAGLAPMYLTEIAPVHLRGAIGTIYQLIITISILLSQILGLPQILGTPELWPLLFGLTIIPSIFMLVTLPMCPETPKYVLIISQKEDEAKKVLRWLRGTEDVSHEMNRMKAESKEMKSVPKVTLKDMWTNMHLRKPLIISIVIMLSQQLSGINAVIFYSTNIFQTAGLNLWNAVYATLGMGVINVLWTVVSMVLVERAGRKTLHLIGLGGMMISTILLTVSIHFSAQERRLTYLCIFLIIGFIIFFATGPGSIPWFLVTELFGQGPRAIATSIAVAVNWFANFIVSIAFLPIEEEIGEYVFLIFAAFLAIFLIFTFIEVPETKGRTIEEITAIFKEKS